jgi:adenine-specific DNA-methyltransferase
LLSEIQLRALVDHLSTGISVIDGRTYAGGLTKFEPGEMERLFVPGPDLLSALVDDTFSDTGRARL